MEWLVERGIGEDRALLLDHDRAIAARLAWPRMLSAGTIAEGVLASRRTGASRGTMRFADGSEALIDQLPQNAREGAPMIVEILREAIAEQGRFKLARCRASAAPPRPAPTLAERLSASGIEVATTRRFPAGLWEEVLDEAWDGAVAFAGGALVIAVTPAMVVIDIDGTLPPRELALAAVPAIAGAIHRLDLAGAIGIDFPSLAQHADRQAVDTALATALAGWRHERTAMNGFGFVQLVARLTRPSLPAMLARDRAGAAARRLLRVAEAVEAPGALLLTAHPAVRAAMRREWIEALARRSGRMLRWHEDASLALLAGFAQAVPP